MATVNGVTNNQALQAAENTAEVKWGSFFTREVTWVHSKHLASIKPSSNNTLLYGIQKTAYIAASIFVFIGEALRNGLSMAMNLIAKPFTTAPKPKEEKPAEEKQAEDAQVAQNVKQNELINAPQDNILEANNVTPPAEPPAPKEVVVLQRKGQKAAAQSPTVAKTLSTFVQIAKNHSVGVAATCLTTIAAAGAAYAYGY